VDRNLGSAFMSADRLLDGYRIELIDASGR
jgi:hypothetical protein